MTQAEIDMLKSAIGNHVSMLYKYAESYKLNGSTEAQKDCLAEIKKYRELEKKISGLSVA